MGGLRWSKISGAWPWLLRLSLRARVLVAVLLTFSALVSLRVHGSSIALTSQLWAPESAMEHFVAAPLLRHMSPEAATSTVDSPSRISATDRRALIDMNFPPRGPRQIRRCARDSRCHNDILLGAGQLGVNRRNPGFFGGGGSIFYIRDGWPPTKKKARGNPRAF
jgi:hypothetical protein